MAELPNDLTRRELEVVRLLVDGLSNQEIADQLSLSRRTVQAHVASAMSRTQTRSRTQLAVLALRRRIVPICDPASDSCDD